MSSSSRLYAGINGSVTAVDRTHGPGNLADKLIAGKYDFVHVVLENNELYAATRGEIFTLDPVTGQIRWHNRLSGLGRGPVTIASSAQGGNAVQHIEELESGESAAATAAMLSGE